MHVHRLRELFHQTFSTVRKEVQASARALARRLARAGTGLLPDYSRSPASLLSQGDMVSGAPPVCGAKDGPQQELERERPRWLRKGVGWTALSTGGERGPALDASMLPRLGVQGGNTGKARHRPAPHLALHSACRVCDLLLRVLPVITITACALQILQGLKSEHSLFISLLKKEFHPLMPLKGI